MDPRNIFRRQESKPKRFAKPSINVCYRCSMPAPWPCEFPGCTIRMCLKHRIRKGGGTLCVAHKNARLVQDTAKPQTKFGNSGIARPHREQE